MDVNIDSMIVCVSIFFVVVLCQNVMYYCTALSVFFDWICALQAFIIMIIIIIILKTIQQSEDSPKESTSQGRLYYPGNSLAV